MEALGLQAGGHGHEQMGDAEGLELMGDAFPVVWPHADHGDVAEEIPAFLPGRSRSGR